MVLTNLESRSNLLVVNHTYHSKSKKDLYSKYNDVNDPHAPCERNDINGFTSVRGAPCIGLLKLIMDWNTVMYNMHANGEIIN